MFYSKDILSAHSGHRLSIIWLAATGKFARIKKSDKHFQDIMNIIIYKVCENLKDHIPKENEKPKNDVELEKYMKSKFSLYLSSMLASGILRIYRSQVSYLYDAVSSFKYAVTEESLAKKLLQKKKPRKEKLNESMGAVDIFFGSVSDFEGFDVSSIIDSHKKQNISEIRKKGLAVKKKAEESVDVMREVENFEEDNIGHLIREWGAPILFPHAVDSRDITLIEEEPLLRPAFPFTKEISGLHPVSDLALGPLDFIPPDNYLKDSISQTFEVQEKNKQSKLDKRLDKDPVIIEERVDIEKEVIAEQEPIKEKQLEDEQVPKEKELPEVESEIGKEAFPIQQTPQQPPIKPGQPPLKKKSRKPLPTDDETCLIQQTNTERAGESSESQIALGSLDEIRKPKLKIKTSKKKKRIFIDQEIRISQDSLKEQNLHYEDTMREKVPSADIINAYWWNVMKSPSQFFLNYQRVNISVKLRKLITRNYVTNPQDARYEIEEPVHRQFQKLGEGRESSVISYPSSITLDSSKTPTDKSHLTPTLSHLETPAPLPAPPSNLVPLQPIQEEQVEITPRQMIVDPAATPLGLDGPRSIKPTVLFSDTGREESVSEPKDSEATAKDLLQDAEERRLRKGMLSPDKGFSYGVAPIEVHGEPTRSDSILHPQAGIEEISTGTSHLEPPHKKPKSDDHTLPSAQHLLQEVEKRKLTTSPDKGISLTTVSVEVHPEPVWSKKSSMVCDVEPEKVKKRKLDVRDITPFKRPEDPFPVMSTAQRILEEAETRKERKGISSPDEGFSVQKVPVEIHSQPMMTSREILESEISSEQTREASAAAASLHGRVKALQDFEKIMSLGLSPVGKPKLPRIVATPGELPEESRLLIERALNGRQRVKFEDLLPENPTRLDVANMFGNLLYMHKKRTVFLTQERPYDQLFVDGLF